MATAREKDDTIEKNIEKLHRKMVYKLSEEIAPYTKRTWNRFKNMMRVNISKASLAAAEDIFDICDELLEQGTISFGEYKVLLEAFKTIQHRTCQDIILEYTGLIRKLKNSQSQQRTSSNSSDNLKMHANVEIDDIKSRKPRAEVYRKLFEICRDGLTTIQESKLSPSEIIQTMSGLRTETMAFMAMLEKLEEKEITAQNVEQHCLMFTFEVRSRKGLDNIWAMYISGELLQILQEGLISQQLLRSCNAEYIKLKVYISEKEYTECLSNIEISEFKAEELFDESIDVKSKNESQTSDKKRQFGSEQSPDRPVQKESTGMPDRDTEDSEEKIKLSTTPMASSLRRAQIPIRAHGSKDCPYHDDMEVTYMCTDCGGELICGTCMATTHNGHAVKLISTFVTKAKTAIQVFVNKAENTYLPEFQGKVKVLEAEISRNKSHYKNVIAKIKKQNEDLMLKLDEHKNTMIKLCKDCEKQNSITINSNKTELQSRMKELNDTIHQLKDTLQSGTDTQVYDTARNMLNDVTVPALPLLQDMDFSPTPGIIDQLENMLRPLKKVERTPKDIFVKYELFNAFKHQGYINRMQTHSDVNRVWVKDGGSKLSLLNNAGHVQKRIEMDDDIDDFCVLPTTGDIYFCSHVDSSVRKVTGDNMSTLLFSTNIIPLSICISADGDMLVGMKQDIVKYTQRGQILCKSTQVKQVPVIKHPVSISQCPVTRNIAVLDRDSVDCGGVGKRHVSVLNEDLQLLYTYYGHDEKRFDPLDLCYDVKGDIYIADRHNNSIQRIKGSGEFIQIVYSDTDESLQNLRVQSNGDIWTVFSDHSFAVGGKAVKVLQKQ